LTEPVAMQFVSPVSPEDESRDEDAQLRAAVEELMQRLGPERKASNGG